jgi:GNAT superfamily N-acetyltransferase
MNYTQVSIREVQLDELTAVNTMIVGCFKQFIAPDYVEEGIQECLNFMNPTALEKRLTGGNLLLVALSGDDVVGALEIRSNEHISLFFVKPECHRQGVGRRLLKTAIQKCREANPILSEIEVHSSPYAVGIYKQLGFTVMGPEAVDKGIRFTPMRMNIPAFYKSADLALLKSVRQPENNTE